MKRRKELGVVSYVGGHCVANLEVFTLSADIFLQLLRCFRVHNQCKMEACACVHEKEKVNLSPHRSSMWSLRKYAYRDERDSTQVLKAFL